MNSKNYNSESRGIARALRATAAKTRLGFGALLRVCSLVILLACLSVQGMWAQTGNWSGYNDSRFAGGSGTQADPYRIETAAQLAYFANKVTAGTSYAGKYVVLAADIDLGAHWWQPIGALTDDNKNCLFQGIFDGGMHVIRNMTIDWTSGSNNADEKYGLFSTLYNAKVYNVVFENAMITATKAYNFRDHKNLGVLAGMLDHSATGSTEVKQIVIRNSEITDGGYETNAQRSLAGLFAPSSLRAGGLAGYVANKTKIYVEYVVSDVNLDFGNSSGMKELIDLETSNAKNFLGGVFGYVDVNSVATFKHLSVYGTLNPDRDHDYGERGWTRGNWRVKNVYYGDKQGTGDQQVGDDWNTGAKEEVKDKFYFIGKISETHISTDKAEHRLQFAVLNSDGEVVEDLTGFKFDWYWYPSMAKITQTGTPYLDIATSNEDRRISIAINGKKSASRTGYIMRAEYVNGISETHEDENDFKHRFEIKSEDVVVSKTVHPSGKSTYAWIVGGETVSAAAVASVALADKEQSLSLEVRHGDALIGKVNHTIEPEYLRIISEEHTGTAEHTLTAQLVKNEHVHPESTTNAFSWYVDGVRQKVLSNKLTLPVSDKPRTVNVAVREGVVSAWGKTDNNGDIASWDAGVVFSSTAFDEDHADAQPGQIVRVYFDYNSDESGHLQIRGGLQNTPLFSTVELENGDALKKEYGYNTPGSQNYKKAYSAFAKTALENKYIDIVLTEQTIQEFKETPMNGWTAANHFLIWASGSMYVTNVEMRTPGVNYVTSVEKKSINIASDDYVMAPEYMTIAEVEEGVESRIKVNTVYSPIHTESPIDDLYRWYVKEFTHDLVTETDIKNKLSKVNAGNQWNQAEWQFTDIATLLGDAEHCQLAISFNKKYENVPHLRTGNWTEFSLTLSDNGDLTLNLTSDDINKIKNENGLKLWADYNLTITNVSLTTYTTNVGTRYAIKDDPNKGSINITSLMKGAEVYAEAKNGDEVLLRSNVITLANPNGPLVDINPLNGVVGDFLDETPSAYTYEREPENAKLDIKFFDKVIYSIQYDSRDQYAIDDKTNLHEIERPLITWDFTYTRDIAPGMWVPFISPVSFTAEQMEEQGLRVARLYDINFVINADHTNTDWIYIQLLQLHGDDATEANVPCMVLRDEAATGHEYNGKLHLQVDKESGKYILVGDKNPYWQQCASVEYIFTFCGTFQPIGAGGLYKAPGSDKVNYVLSATDGRWHRPSQTLKLPANRFYVSLERKSPEWCAYFDEEPSMAPSIRMRLVGEDEFTDEAITTAISEVEAADINNNVRVNAAQIGLRPGSYIIGGKQVVVE